MSIKVMEKDKAVSSMRYNFFLNAIGLLLCIIDYCIMTVKKTEIMKFEDPMLVTLFSLTKNVKSFQGNSQDIFLCLLCE